MADSGFYLGRIFDTKAGKPGSQAVTYDPADLTTHAVVTGMTGSGKTGLCINLLEEAALQGIPAIIIDPKGDLTNLLLHFPELAPQDFKPWIDPDIARRADKSIDEAANEASNAWRKGLTEWGINKERLMALQNAAQFAVFTPGSDAGIPVSVLSSLAAPNVPWEENREALREKISSTVTALLGLIGYDDIDPVRSREHILLSNIFENEWSQGRNVELNELILQTQSPPFNTLGAFPIDTFFPPKERMDLAVALNNILASSSFEFWREGFSLDVDKLLYTDDKRPRHCVFYLAHLSDREKMFFITLLLASVETWMRGQSGTSGLRALLYMDEIYGYIPPISNPSTKPIFLRMVKQARAFGLGLLLATQNPVDVDYKALSNAGTWFIGKLQTQQDKDRLLDGLQGVAGGVSRTTMDNLISTLNKRVFILHNVHEKAPILFQTRWTMNFLAGPLTKKQIPELNQLVHAESAFPAAPTTEGVPWGDAPSVAQPKRQSVESFQAVPIAGTQNQDASSPVSETPLINKQSSPKINGTVTKPPVPAGVREYFLPQNHSLPEAFKAAQRAMPAQAMIKGIIYQPALLAAAQVRFLDRKLGVDINQNRVVIVQNPDKGGVIRWDDFLNNVSVDQLDSGPTPQARFGMVDSPMNDSKRMTALQKDFTDWVYRNSTVSARANQKLKVFAGPDVTQAEFIKACADSAREQRDAEVAKRTTQLDKKLKTLQEKLAREERELQVDQTELSERKTESIANLAELGAGLLGLTRKKTITSQFTKQRLSKQAEADVDESVKAIADFKSQIADLERERQSVMDEVNSAWGDVVNQIEEITVTAKKTDIFVKVFGIGWVPYYVIDAGGETLEIPAFGA